MEKTMMLIRFPVHPKIRLWVSLGDDFLVSVWEAFGDVGLTSLWILGCMNILFPPG